MSRTVQSWYPLPGIWFDIADGVRVTAIMDATRRCRDDIVKLVGVRPRGPFRYTIRRHPRYGDLVIVTTNLTPKGTP